MICVFSHVYMMTGAKGDFLAAYFVDPSSYIQVLLLETTDVGCMIESSGSDQSCSPHHVISFH